MHVEMAMYACTHITSYVTICVHVAYVCIYSNVAMSLYCKTVVSTGH